MMALGFSRRLPALVAPSAMGLALDGETRPSNVADPLLAMGYLHLKTKRRSHTILVPLENPSIRF
jgi:hypothetical protein